MKAAVWHGANDIQIEETETPSLERGQVLIKVLNAGICGTDLMIYKGKFPRSRPPLILGHEFVGDVDSADEIPVDLKPGERVVVNPLIHCGRCVSCRMGFPHVCASLRLIGVDINGAFAEFVKASWDKVHRIPPEFPPHEAALIEPTAVAVHAVTRSGCKVGDHVVVLGAGPIGLLIAMVARVAGASEVVVTEVLKERIVLTESLGFDVIDSSRNDVVKELLGKTHGNGADIVFEAAAVPQTATQLVSLIRPRGRILIVGLYKETPFVDLLSINFKEGEIMGSRVYSDTDFEKAVALVTSGRLDVTPLITDQLDLGDVTEGFRLVERGESRMKVILSP
jgi:2-desacetyl-2-hydroxyethyl bacteriochlorophyllide A dehydrogenase